MILGEERDNVTSLINAMGFSHSERLTKSNTHLICKVLTHTLRLVFISQLLFLLYKEPIGAKFDKAREWQTAAIVKVEWLIRSALKVALLSNWRFFYVVTCTNHPTNHGHQGKILDTKHYALSQDVEVINKRFEENQRDNAKLLQMKRSRGGSGFVYSLSTLQYSLSICSRVLAAPPKAHNGKQRSTPKKRSTGTPTCSSSSAVSSLEPPSQPFLSDVTILVCKKLEQVWMRKDILFYFF